MSIAALILAAGEGTRMKSTLPKVLHPLCGKPMILHVVENVRKSRVERIILVVGHKSEEIKTIVGNKVEYAIQKKQLGTGHALQSALSNLKDFDGDLLILYGDTPLLKAETIKRLIQSHRRAKAISSLLTCFFRDPTGYGRIIRNKDGELVKIKEEGELSFQEKMLKEGNPGLYIFEKKAIFRALKEVRPDNRKKEYYLTDVIEVLIGHGERINSISISDETQALGINSKEELALANSILYQEINKMWMDKGISIIDPNSTFIDDEAKIGKDTIILPFTFLEGKTKIGESCRIGPSVRIANSNLSDNISVQFSLIEGAKINSGVEIRPFSYIYPGTKNKTQRAQS